MASLYPLNLSFAQHISALEPGAAERWGFRPAPASVHTSRTLMLGDLDGLLFQTPENASPEDYAHTIVRENCLGKETQTGRDTAHRRLRELYALDPAAGLFRALRRLWPPTGQPGAGQMALLLALARDSLLRATAPAVLGTPIGHELSRQALTDALAEAAGDRLNPATLDKVARNAAASWTQSGHLEGRSRKFRRRVTASPRATAYALLMGQAAGKGGAQLFESPWVAVLDADAHELLERTRECHRLGLLDFRESGGYIDISFSRSLAGPEPGGPGPDEEGTYIPGSPS